SMAASVPVSVPPSTAAPTPMAPTPVTPTPVTPKPVTPKPVTPKPVTPIPTAAPVPGPVGASASARRADDDDVLTVDELVAWLRLSESTVLKLLSERAIPARKVGHQWRIRRGRVRDWLDGRE